VLACDTSTDYAVFALGDEDGNIIKSTTFRHNRDLSRRLYESLDSVLSSTGRQFRDIDILSVGIGPGSFTGVRVAVTTMKTLAQAGEKKLIAVGTLDCYAMSPEFFKYSRRVVVLPSRKGEIYYQTFDDTGELAPPTVATYDRLTEILGSFSHDASLVICGQTNVLPPQFNKYDQIEQTAPPARTLIQITAHKLLKSDFADPITLSPVYAAPPAISQHKSR
jgi:tRNA threonylcarbamoyladenosine biosynthesis protein TsaB